MDISDVWDFKSSSDLRYKPIEPDHCSSCGSKELDILGIEDDGEGGYQATARCGNLDCQFDKYNAEYFHVIFDTEKDSWVALSKYSQNDLKYMRLLRRFRRLDEAAE